MYNPLPSFSIGALGEQRRKYKKKNYTWTLHLIELEHLSAASNGDHLGLRHRKRLFFPLLEHLEQMWFLFCFKVRNVQLCETGLDVRYGTLDYTCHDTLWMMNVRWWGRRGREENQEEQKAEKQQDIYVLLHQWCTFVNRGLQLRRGPPLSARWGTSTLSHLPAELVTQPNPSSWYVGMKTWRQAVQMWAWMRPRMVPRVYRGQRCRRAGPAPTLPSFEEPSWSSWGQEEASKLHGKSRSLL